MNKHTKFLPLGLAVLVMLATSSPAPLLGQPTPQPAPPHQPIQPVPLMNVNLTAVPSAGTYSVGSPIAITLTLTNQSRVPVGLSDFLAGTLVVTSVTRNGGPLPISATDVIFDDGFPAGLASSLQSVVPGASLSFIWISDFNQVLGGEALLVAQYTGQDRGPATYYSIAQPGSYSITFRYRYPGPTNSFPGTVFTGQTNSVTVSFTVV